MLWPKDRKLYENLKTTFVNLDALIEELKDTRFSGYVEVVFENEGIFYVLLSPGNEPTFLVKEAMGDKKVSLSETTDLSLQDKLAQQTARINVYELSPERLKLIVGYLNAVPLYTNLNSEFTDFRRLVAKLSKDGLNGYLEIKFVQFPEEPYYVFFDKGDIYSLFMEGNEAGKEEKDAYLEEIGEKLEEYEAQFDVYEAKYESTKIDGEGKRGGEKTGKEETVIRKKEEEKEETKLEQMDEKEEGKGEIQREEDKKVEKLRKSETEDISEETKIPVDDNKVKRSEDKGSTLETLSIIPYLDFTAALLYWVETAVNKEMGKDYFIKAFKKGLLNISDKYPFLDPFLAEFTYEKGKAQFVGDAKAIDFLKGIYMAIDSMFEELTKKERKDVKKYLLKTRPVFEKKYHEVIEILRVRTLMPFLFQ